MPRALKPQKLDSFTHRSYGVTVDLMLDRNSHDFFFDLGGNTFRAESMSDLTRKAREAIAESHNLTWLPMITVTRLEPFACRTNAFVGFEYDRSWIARKVDGKWLQCSWVNYERENPNEALRWSHDFYPGRKVTAFKLPSHGEDRDDAKTFYLPHSDELWHALEIVCDKITELRKRLDALMMTEKGIAKLSTLATGLLLGVGEPEK